MPVMLGVLVLITASGQVMLTRLMNISFSKFNVGFSIFKAIKFIILMTLMITYSLMHRDQAVPFLITTFILYIAYMIFESRSLNRYSKNQGKG
jgi:ABC-type methionine transport system permease subunit